MEDYPMLEDIIINRANELIPILNKMGKRGSLLMVLFALERQWQLFLEEIKAQTKYEDLCNSAKQCKDILWEHFFNPNKHHLSRNISRYLELTEKFESLEFGIDVYYSRPLIENLMQADFLLNETEGVGDTRDCAYMILSPLEVIFNYCVDTIKGQLSDAAFIKILEDDSRVISELNRVNNDMLLANNLSYDIDTIIGLRHSYQELKLI